MLLPLVTSFCVLPLLAMMEILYNKNHVNKPTRWVEEAALLCYLLRKLEGSASLLQR